LQTNRVWWGLWTLLWLSDDRWSDGTGRLSPNIERACQGRALWLYFRVVASAYRRARNIDRRGVEGRAFLVGLPLYIAVNDGTVLHPGSSATSFSRVPFVVDGT
jgi:hypothetical protein